MIFTTHPLLTCCLFYSIITHPSKLDYRTQRLFTLLIIKIVVKLYQLWNIVFETYDVSTYCGKPWSHDQGLPQQIETSSKQCSKVSTILLLSYCFLEQWTTSVQLQIVVFNIYSPVSRNLWTNILSSLMGGFKTLTLLLFFLPLGFVTRNMSVKRKQITSINWNKKRNNTDRWRETIMI